MTYLIEAQQLNKTYGKHQVIQDLNLQIKQGAWWPIWEQMVLGSQRQSKC